MSLSRSVPTLSGGELQRVRLSAQLGSGLTGIVYVLDEPSSGLHPNDGDNLVEVLIDLRDRGNTVILVEHDMDVVRRCDWVVDIGPAAGADGGRLLASGTPSDVAQSPSSVTGPYLARTVAPGRTRPLRPEPDAWLSIAHLTRNNIADAAITVPLGRYTCITGVSGSGKSTLLAAASEALRSHLDDRPSRCEISGAGSLRWIEQVTQAPIGRNGRSNPATYTKLFDRIRRLFASTPAAAKAGLDETAFSFNTDSGRCPECEGYGDLTVDMHYLPSITTTCPTCRGRRFQDQILDITIQDHSIADVLDLTVDEAAEMTPLQTEDIAPMIGHLQSVGLGYLTLGQPATVLTGGEAQRLKLARLLARTARSGNGFVVLDEPTARPPPDRHRAHHRCHREPGRAGHDRAGRGPSAGDPLRSRLDHHHRARGWTCGRTHHEPGPSHRHLTKTPAGPVFENPVRPRHTARPAPARLSAVRAARPGSGRLA